MTQTEAHLETALIHQLNGLGYQTIPLKNESDLIANLRTTLATINGITAFSDLEWQQIISHLATGTNFDKANRLRDKFSVKFDNGTSKHIFFLADDPAQNQYQIANQISLDHRKHNGRKSRFDVTILINGLPLVQIELKRRGMEIAEAFHQTLRYDREAYGTGQGLFGYLQLFVISNGVNTRYYANGTKNIEFAFAWADRQNKQINEISDFADVFLNPTHLTKMLTQYMILMSTSKTLMVMRPYQIYAVENIIEHIHHSNENGYIWHTTGSGKTLTSFKASQLIMTMPEVAKVLFVVDRNDLDTQTSREFNHFKADSVDSTSNTKTLVEQMGKQHDKLIVTTLQKLNNAISKEHYSDTIAYLKDQKVVFIFDECHRSQFGETHKKIKQFFNNAQMFGFTGTPIFEKNSTKKGGLKLTTNYLFDQCLHQYVIVDAIRDKNVLPFQIDYMGRYTAKGMKKSNEPNAEQGETQTVEGIDTKEVLEDPKRLKMIARHIIDNHAIKTKHGEFTALFCVSSVDVLTQYYDLFQQAQAEKQAEDEAKGKLFKPLTIATIFSYSANEAVADNPDGIIDEESTDIPTQINQSNRDKLDGYIADYNATFGTNYNSGDSYYAYYRDIANRVRNKQIDILLVVNMFLTGFDSKPLNTLYVDKNLKHHGLIQAFSRTNRVMNANKPFGNIVCYRNLKFATDDALALFSDKDKAKEVVIIPDFEVILQKYETAVAKLKTIVPTYQEVDELYTEAEQLTFIQAFRDVLRLHTQLQTFSEYNQDTTSLSKQEFANYASKYRDLKPPVGTGGAKNSILEDIDFQLDLLHSDRVNVGYIVKLLQLAKNSHNKDQQRQYQKQIQDILINDISLHNKQDLIQKFIQENLPKMPDGQTVEEAFKDFWDVEKENAYQQLCEEENLKADKLQEVIQSYEFTQRLPRKDELADLPNYKVGLLERTTVLSHLMNKTHQLIERFYQGM